MTSSVRATASAGHRQALGPAASPHARFRAAHQSIREPPFGIGYGLERRRFNPPERRPNPAKSLRQSALCRITRAMNAVDLASLLCSRLCHDLMSPVGALNNGIELLSDEQDPDMREKCLELLADSARASANKLKFFRLAFGAGGGFGEEIDTREAQLALEGVFGPERRIELGWMVASDKLPKGAVKLLLNVALLAGDALVRGRTPRCRGRTQRRGYRACHPRGGAAGPARSLPARCADWKVERRRSRRAASRRRLACQRACQEVDGTIQLSDPSSEVLMIGVRLPRQG